MNQPQIESNARGGPVRAPLPIICTEADPDQTARIAQTAYYLAEKRGFAPGHELEDWLEAEQTICHEVQIQSAAERV